MTNVVTLHGDKRWKAVLEYQHENGPINIEYFLEEICELQQIVEHGPDWNTLIRCTVTLSRPDGGEIQSCVEKARPSERGSG